MIKIVLKILSNNWKLLSKIVLFSAFSIVTKPCNLFLIIISLENARMHQLKLHGAFSSIYKTIYGALDFL